MQIRNTIIVLFIFISLCLLSACGGKATPASEPEPYPYPGAPQDAPVSSTNPASNPPPPGMPPSGSPYPAPGSSELQPWEPQPGDSALQHGKVYLNPPSLSILESFPVQIVLNLDGSLPTPCHQLRAQIEAPDPEKRIEIEVYSVTDPVKLCVQVLEPFEVNIPLGSFPTGHYTVWVNGEMIGEFDS